MQARFEDVTDQPQNDMSSLIGGQSHESMLEELEQREQADGDNAAAQLASPKGKAAPSSPRKRGRALWRLASSPRKPGLQKGNPSNRKGSS